MSIVYCVQQQMRFDAALGHLVPKFDLDKAACHGELVYLLSPSASPFNTDSIIPELQRKLADFTNEDHLLLVGNPVLIGLASAIAANANDGCVNFLQWSGKDQRYLSIHTARIFPDGFPYHNC